MRPAPFSDFDETGARQVVLDQRGQLGFVFDYRYFSGHGARFKLRPSQCISAGADAAQMIPGVYAGRVAVVPRDVEGVVAGFDVDHPSLGLYI